MHTPIKRIPHTLLGNVLNTFKKSVITAKSMGTDEISTTLIEEDFVFSLQSYCAKYFQLLVSNVVLLCEMDKKY